MCNVRKDSSLKLCLYVYVQEWDVMQSMKIENFSELGLSNYGFVNINTHLLDLSKT